MVSSPIFFFFFFGSPLKQHPALCDGQFLTNESRAAAIACHDLFVSGHMGILIQSTIATGLDSL